MGGCGATGRRAGTFTDKLRLTVRIIRNPLAEMREDNARNLACSRIGESPGYRCGKEGLIPKPPVSCFTGIDVLQKGHQNTPKLPIGAPRMGGDLYTWDGRGIVGIRGRHSHQKNADLTRACLSAEAESSEHRGPVSH